MGFVNFIKNIWSYYTFTIVCFLYLFNPKNYTPASRETFIKQVFYTAIEILPVFILLTVIFGIFIVGVFISLAIEYGLKEYIGYIIVKIIIVELSPFIIALFISLRTGIRVGIKLALMKVNNELNSLQKYRIDIVKYLCMPMALANTVSFVSLLFLFALIMILSSYVYIFLSIDMGFDIFLTTLLNAVSLKDIIIFLVKSLIFGFIIITIPSYDGIHMEKRYFKLPKSLSKTMLSLFFIIFLVEVLSLAIEYI